MDIKIPKDGITSLFDKLAEKIFTDTKSTSQSGPFKVHFNKKICSRLRNVVYECLLSRQEGLLRGFVEEEHEFNVKERLCIVGYKLRSYGLASKANHLEKLLSNLDFSSQKSSVYTGHLDVVNEAEALVKILLALSNETKLLTCDPCEVWRKTDHCYQISVSDQISLLHDSGIEDDQINIAYEYFPREIFEAPPTFGVPKRGFEHDANLLQFDIFNQEPGSCGLIKWFGAKTNDSFSETTRTTLFTALIHSRTLDMDVKLQLPELPRHPDLWWKPPEDTQVTEDDGFVDATDDCELSTTSSTVRHDSGIGLDIWDEAMKMKPTRFRTWEGRKQIISKSPKPYLTEAGPDVVNYLCDIKMAEAAFLIDSHPEQLRYRQMTEFIRDCLMLLIGVPSQTFQLEKSTGSFHVSSKVRLSGCSPDSLQKSLTELADIGTNYFRLNKFTTCQRHSTLIRSSVLRAFITGLQTYLQKYRQSVITAQASRVQSVLDLGTKFRKQANQLKFLSDICMCSEGFAAQYGKPKPKFPVGVKLLSYLYELCLRNINSVVANLLLFLLKVSCTPYLRFVHQWVFKGKCIDLYKEFMIFENDVYLAYRDKHYWTNGYVMSGTDKMEGVPVFLKELSKDMFICGKSINLLKLCCPEHYICNHEVKIPLMAVVYSLSSLQRISDASREYAEQMSKLQDNVQLEWRREKNEEKHKQQQLLANERQKANKALAEIRELVEKAKEVLAEKRKEELDFLKQQMEDAINRKVLESKQTAEEDARFVRTSLRYEVTTARLDDELAEQARQELIHYYEELTREAEKREKRAIWLAQRHALKNERDRFLEKEKVELDELRITITERLETAAATANEQPREDVRNDASQSTVQDLIYNSSNAVESKKTYPRLGQAMQSTAQEVIYPSSRDMAPSSGIEISTAPADIHGHNKVARATDSSVQDLLYPTSNEGVVTRPDGRDGDPSVPQSATSTGIHGARIVTRATDSTVQNMMYHSEEGKEIQDTSLQNVGNKGGAARTVTSRATDSTVQNFMYHTEPAIQHMSSDADGSEVGGTRTVTRAMDSTAQNLMYHNLEEQMVPHRTTRGVGNAFQSTIQKDMYGNGGHSGTKISNREFEPAGEMKGVLYPRDLGKDSQGTTLRGSEQPSVMKDILYPVDSGHVDGISRRGSGPASSVKDIIYPEKFGGGKMAKSTRGSAPLSTIQNLMYRSASVTEEPEERERQPLTHEDVWLASQFEPLPDNFDILDEEPCGDIFARVKLSHSGVLNYHQLDEHAVDEGLDGENDACDVLCLPVILQRCVMEPLITQIKVVNSAVVRYFMDNLKLVDHFETLKKFLLMEDGEFSFSLTQQLFEKISSGITPQQLCCISTLNSVMAQSIQSSVYACQSENTRSLSFVLKSIPDIFKRNDVKVLDFIELRYKIRWPVNIIITENCITKYNRIFAFMLRLKRTAWILQDIRYFLKRVDKSASNSPQLRKIHLFRHEMSHFVNDVQEYISNQILHVSWQEFLNSLEHNEFIQHIMSLRDVLQRWATYASTDGFLCCNLSLLPPTQAFRFISQVRNLDDLHDCHADYLNKALSRALLNKKAAPVMKIISDLFTKVLKFHTQLVSSSWYVDPSSGHVVHPGFPLLCSTYESFKESTCFLLTVITKLVTRGYQPHLEELLLRLNFNSYYGKNISTLNPPTFEV